MKQPRTKLKPGDPGFPERGHPYDLLPENRKQQELPLESIHLKPLHLFYLMAIYTGDFDTKLHRGWYAEHAVFAERIKDLLDWGLITYNGKHDMTKRGTRHVNYLLSKEVK